MAETDSTRPSASVASRAERVDDDAASVGADSGAPDASRVEDDAASGAAAAGTAASGAGDPDRGEEPIPATTQRDPLPMREAAGRPDLPGVDGDEGTPGGHGATVSTASTVSPASTAATASPDGQDPAGVPAAAAVAGPSSGAGSSGSGSHAPAAVEPSTDTAALSVRPPDSEAARRAAARDQAAAAKPALPRFLQVVVALFFPVIVVAAAIRAVATSSFLWLEYHRPGFPADRFGFSLDDRMTYGSYALDYVLNFAPPRYLGDLVTPEGEPLFLESEVGHMADVKGVLGLSFVIALVLLVLAVAACTYLARHYKGGVRRALFSGAVLTLVGMVVLTVLAILAWQTFFTQVHALFFADGTWTFRVDDTLIRLFPEQFWTDSAVTVAVLVLTATILTLVLTWPTKARRDRSMMAQDAARARSREALDAP
ncbi:TIGR01906 family membrane protein [Arthrobacter sp. SX1312]|uniref:TIGR01906 family membrane protein n=1 Tax=Arthrobacter sp. SX1312 TaxID=2058896 RepID=UPI002157FFCE|nr:TIGR01906 family membrane protein [Arthrobacter sp. SX1312]